MKLLLLLSLIFTLSCVQKKSTGSGIFYVLGSNDIEAVTPAIAASLPQNILNSAVLIATSVNVNGQSGTIFCSGNFIHSPNDNKTKIISNNHCFSQEATNHATRFPEACTKTKVYVGWSQGNIPAGQLTCKQGSLMTDTQKDIALFEVNETIPQQYLPGLTIESSSSLPTSQQSPFVLHFPNEDKFPKTTYGEDYAQIPRLYITRKNCAATGTFTTQEQTALDRANPTAKVDLKYSFKHTCDLVEGSSGSAIISLTSGRIIGLNWGGAEFATTNNQQIQYNAAVRSNLVNDFVNSNGGPNLNSQTPPQTQNASVASPGISINRASTQKSSSPSSSGCGVVPYQANIPMQIVLIILPVIIGLWNIKKLK